DCPDCAHLQPDMLNLLKNDRLSLVIGTALAFIAALFFGFGPVTSFDPDVFFVLLVIAGLVLLVIGIALIAESGIFQSVYAFAVLGTLVFRAIQNLTLIRLMVPIGMIALLIDVFF